MDLRRTPKQVRRLYGGRSLSYGEDAPRFPNRSIPTGTSGTCRFTVADGTLEALKWMALGLMLLDHINKFFFAEQLPWIFPMGRIVMPIFGFVLVFNLARPDALERGVHLRIMRRLALTALIATPITIALNHTVVSHHSWWPINILYTLLTVVVLIYWIERGGVVRYMAAAGLFILAGALVEYLWVGLLACLGAWAFCRNATAPRLVLWVLGVLSLTLVNVNAWALAAIPIICLAAKYTAHVPRSKWVFYSFYPAHLAVLLAIKELHSL